MQKWHNQVVPNRPITRSDRGQTNREWYRLRAGLVSRQTIEQH